MALITLLDAQLAFGHVALLDHADFALESAERVGLIGRNGAGKSSMLKILAGMEKPDDGALQVQTGLRITYVAQEPNLDSDATVFEAASVGLAGVIAARDQYLSGEDGLDLNALQSIIEAYDAWNWEQRVEETLHRLHLDPNAVVGTLSGGTKKRVALAQALVLATQVAAGPELAMARIKPLCRSAHANTLEDQLELEARFMVQSQETEESREGMGAFLEKRPADFAPLRTRPA